MGGLICALNIVIVQVLSVANHKQYYHVVCCSTSGFTHSMILTEKLAVELNPGILLILPHSLRLEYSQHPCR